MIRPEEVYVLYRIQAMGWSFDLNNLTEGSWILLNPYNKEVVRCHSLISAKSYVDAYETAKKDYS